MLSPADLMRPSALKSNIAARRRREIDAIPAPLKKEIFVRRSNAVRAAARFARG